MKVGWEPHAEQDTTIKGLGAGSYLPLRFSIDWSYESRSQLENGNQLLIFNIFTLENPYLRHLFNINPKKALTAAITGLNGSDLMKINVDRLVNMYVTCRI